MTAWNVLFVVVLACGAIVPGPCTFHPQREWDCGLGDACPERFACAADGYCKSADIACNQDDEERCEVPGLTKVGLCVRKDEFPASKSHCGACFERCLGAGVCEDGTCNGAPTEGQCVRARGNFDCKGGARCKTPANPNDLDDGADGVCVAGEAGNGRVMDACSGDDDCEGGLCVEAGGDLEGKVCTRTCDFGCPLGTECDEDEVPGGLCVPTGDEVCR
jgi:hypothetical protein